MKKTIIFLLLIMTNSFFINSQNIKKAFKELHEKNRYVSAFDIFRSENYLNTSPGKYGIAYIYFYKDIDYQGHMSSYQSVNEKHFRKAFAYSEILKAEELFAEVTNQDKKKLADYFSEQKILTLKKSMEDYFLQMHHNEFKIIFYSLRKFSKGNKFCTDLENKFIKAEFEYIKSNSNTNVETLPNTLKLIKWFPDYENITILKRFADSIRFLQAKNIKDYSIILKKYPDNHFKLDIINKIIEINTDYQSKISKNKSIKDIILVIGEAETEDEAIELLTDKYYSHYSDNKYSTPPNFYYAKMSAEDIKRYNLKKTYLIYLNVNSVKRSSHFKLIDTYKAKHENCYLLDPIYEVQIFSKDKVYEKGVLLDKYQIITFLPTGKYTISPTEFESSIPMRKISNELSLMTKYQFISVMPGDYNIDIYPEGNPYPMIFYLRYFSDFDWNNDDINVIFLCNYKKPYKLKLSPKNINNAVDIIMKEADTYFR